MTILLQAAGGSTMSFWVMIIAMIAGIAMLITGIVLLLKKKNKK